MLTETYIALPSVDDILYLLILIHRLDFAVLAFGTRVRGFKPERNRRIFRAKKSSARLPSEGKQNRRFHVVTLRHVKEPKSDVGVATFGKILCNFSPIVPPSATGVRLRRQTLGTPCGESWNVLITGPQGWVFDVPLATALCKNLPAGNTQR